MTDPDRGATEPGRGRALLLAAVLLVATFGVYAGVGGHDFVSFDDDLYVAANPQVQAGLTGEGVRWAFTTGHAANWHPLTWLSHMLDVELFGVDAGAHHLVSAGLHALTAAVLLLALTALTGRLAPSAFVAAFFALHPLRVESVAWVAERKDVLAGFFAATTLSAYAFYARARRPGRYALVLASFALGLLAKPMLVTLPFVLLLLDRWPLRRTEAMPRLVIEKLPLFALAAASAAVTYGVQQAAGAVDPLGRIGASARIANAFVSCAVYLKATFWPTGLACYYPHPALVRPEDPAWGAGAIAATLLVVALSAAALRWRRAAPWLLVGWFWFLGMLVPVLGVVQVGGHSHADRYTYLPGLGIAIVLAFGARAAVAHRPALRIPVTGAALLWLAALVPVTRRQIETWANSTTLYEHALAVTEGNFMAHNNLGVELERAQRFDEAAAQFRAALAIRPQDAAVQYGLGFVALRLGRRDEALQAFRRAVEFAPQHAEASVNLGLLLAQDGEDAEAVRHLGRAWEANPGMLPAGQGLAWVLATTRDDAVRDGERAVEVAEACLAASPTPPPGLLDTLAAAYAEAGRFDDAVRTQQAVIAAASFRARAAAEERLRLYESGRSFRKSP